MGKILGMFFDLSRALKILSVVVCDLNSLLLYQFMISIKLKLNIRTNKYQKHYKCLIF